jgi:hypothetical protein
MKESYFDFFFDIKIIQRKPKIIPGIPHIEFT